MAFNIFVDGEPCLLTNSVRYALEIGINIAGLNMYTGWATRQDGTYDLSWHAAYILPIKAGILTALTALMWTHLFPRATPAAFTPHNYDQSGIRFFLWSLFSIATTVFQVRELDGASGLGALMGLAAVLPMIYTAGYRAFGRVLTCHWRPMNYTDAEKVLREKIVGGLPRFLSHPLRFTLGVLATGLAVGLSSNVAIQLLTTLTTDSACSTPLLAGAALIPPILILLSLLPKLCSPAFNRPKSYFEPRAMVGSAMVAGGCSYWSFSSIPSNFWMMLLKPAPATIVGGVLGGFRIPERTLDAIATCFRCRTSVEEEGNPMPTPGQ